MNLYNLIKTVKERNQIITETPIKYPEVKIRKGENDEILKIPIIKLYENGWDALMYIANFWDMILPDEGQELYEKQLEIAEAVVGRRQQYDFVLLMKWMSKRIDINNGDFDMLLESELR